MLNHIVLQGRLCSDPELRYTPNQIPVVSFTLAVDRDFTREGGQETDFLDVVAFRKTAEFCAKYFQKGSAAIVSGRMQVRAYKDREGVGRRAYEVVADSVYFGESRRASDRSAETATRPADVAPPFEELTDDGGELPF